MYLSGGAAPFGESARNVLFWDAEPGRVAGRSRVWGGLRPSQAAGAWPGFGTGRA
jgi:hypothetical protein